MYSPLLPNPVTSIGHPWIFLSEISAACKVLNGMRFTKALVSTKALRWYGYPTSISSLLKVISVDSYKRALSFGISAVKHFTLALEAILTRASIAIFLSFAVSPSWSNKFLNLELRCKVVIATTSKAGFSSLSSLGSAQITTTTRPFPLWFGSGFLWTSCWDSSRVLSLILRYTNLRSAQHYAVGCCM